MLKFIKENSVKFVNKDSQLIGVLRADGWMVEGETVKNLVAETLEISERDTLMQKAKEMGLKPHHMLGIEKLREITQGA